MSWEIDIAAGAIGALAGGAGTAVGGYIVGTRQQVMQRRRRLLEETLPELVAMKAETYASGAWRPQLALYLDELRALAASCSGRANLLADRLATAWETAIPDDLPRVGYNPEPVSAELKAGITAAHDALAGRLRREVAPIGARFPQWRLPPLPAPPRPASMRETLPGDFSDSSEQGLLRRYAEIA